MKIKIGPILVLLVAIFVAVSAFNLVNTTTHTGTNVTFDVSTGHVALTNDTDEPVTAKLTSGRLFKVVSSDGELELDSTRQGSGRQVSHVFEGELPTGSYELQVSRGSDIRFELSAPESISAYVVPRSSGDTQTIIILTVLAVLGALYYISRSMDHAWIRSLRRRIAGSSRGQLELSQSPE